ncbi:Nif3-like dinuclear metal center hexameric protein [Buchnera aphidicola]|uniref:Nif3-like dinuclear metal center hexameric protein n=1 Tax=Buchnera aphidicola TaxID=9 RepID=UPI003464C1D7
MNNLNLEKIINEKLKIHLFQDFVPNGLQVEGSSNIKKIITGVSACQDLLDQAVKLHASAIIVHHGYFWNNTDRIINSIQKKRLKTIISNDINLYSWHLPLDAHPELGNNVHIAKKLNIKIKGYLLPLVPWGIFEYGISGSELLTEIIKKYNRTPFYEPQKYNSKIFKIAWCSGKGQGFMKKINLSNLDAFLTGEVSEETIYISRENDLHFFSIGHHASERDGIIALSNWLINKYNLDVTFIDTDNPI